jgi:hypothetical protein
VALTALVVLRTQAAPIRRLDGSTISPAQVDAAVTSLMKAADVTGAGVATFSHGRATYMKFMDQRVFRPLAMTRTSMVWQPAFDENFADGYDEYGRSLGAEKQKTPSVTRMMLITGGPGNSDQPYRR